MTLLVTGYKLATVGSYRLYIEPDGKLFLNAGNVKLRVTPQQARELLDYMLLFARYFDDERQPETQQLEVSSNGAR